MKRFFTFALAAAVTSATFVMTSCGSDDPPEEPKKTLELTPSETEAVEGDDAITFKVTLDGSDITSQATIHNKTAGTTVEGAKFETDTPGEYEFYATYEDLTSTSKKVTIKEDEGKEPEIKSFYKRVGIYQFTEAECTFCPSMKRILAQVAEDQDEDRIVEIAYHTSVYRGDAMTISASNTAAKLFDVHLSGVPAVTFDHTTAKTITSRIYTTINNWLEECKDTEPWAGIGIKSSLNERTITAEVEVEASKDIQCKVALVLVEDGLVGTQVDNGIRIPDYEWNNVARFVFEGEVEGKPIDTIKAGQSVTVPFSYTIPLNAWNLDNCRLVAFVLVNQYSKYYMHNIAQCKLGGSVDIKYLDESVRK